MRLIDVSFYPDRKFGSLPDAVKSFRTSYAYLSQLGKEVRAEALLTLNRNETHADGIRYRAFSPSFLSLKSIGYIRRQRPDVVLVNGLMFPMQVMLLKLLLGRSGKVIQRHHGEQPFKRKRFLQRMADRFTDAYIFTARDNAREWIAAGIVGNILKCEEALEASTNLSRRDREESRQKTGISGDVVFLWVARLNRNKDPFTLLKAFEQYLAEQKNAKLYMIYHEENLLPQVQSLLKKNEALEKAVILTGRISNETLACWYSAADIFISCSHRESTGYALVEAMACGCLPVVTDIPPHRKITGNGKAGMLFEAGNADALFEKMKQASSCPIFPEHITEHFRNELSFKKIAEDIDAICRKLTLK